MTSTFKRAAIAVALSTVGFGGAAQAAAIISNGTVTLGVNDLGHLNVRGGPSSLGGVTAVGLRYNATGAESTAPGCLCEGWGVALQSLGVAGYANEASGTSGLSLLSFSSSASTATSVVSAAGGRLEVTHDYKPSKISNLYQVDVTIKNTSGSAISAADLLYRRVMDWDIEPTAFREVVTIQGVPTLLGIANGNNVHRTDNNGFNSSNPLLFSAGAGGIGGLTNKNFVDAGPADHGALFDFEFAALGNGASLTFTTYYGAAGNETDALAALASVGAGLYSLGQTATGGTTGAPNTFMFAFGAAGGVLTPPDDDGEVPEPAMLSLLGMGLLGMGLSRRRRRA